MFPSGPPIPGGVHAARRELRTEGGAPGAAQEEVIFFKYLFFKMCPVAPQSASPIPPFIFLIETVMTMRARLTPMRGGGTPKLNETWVPW